MAGCTGSLSGDTPEDEPGSQITTGGNAAEDDINFKCICAVNDYAVFTWNESTDKNISYYQFELKNITSNEIGRSEKIQKTGGPYKYILQGLELGTSDWGSYSGTFNGYDSNDKKLFYKYISFNAYKSELTNFKVNYDKSNQTVTCSWERNDKYGKIKHIDILSSDSEKGTYTLHKAIENKYSTSCNISDIEPGKTYWFKLCSYNEAEIIITELTASSGITVEKSAPSQIKNLKTVDSEYCNVLNLTWDKNLFATSYKVLAYPNYKLNSEDLLFEKTVTDNNISLTVDCMENSSSIYFVVKGINELGEGPASDYEWAYISSVRSYAKVVATVSENTSNSAKVLLKMVDGGGKEYSFKDASLEYALYKDSTEYKPYQTSNEFNLTGLEFASKTTLKPRVKINYTIDGQAKTYELIPSSTFDVETNSFPSPSGAWTATKITRNSITLTYPKLTEEERYGLAEDDIVYVVTAYKGDSASSSTTKTASYGEDSVTFTSLSSNSAYSFTVYAKKNTPASAAGAESERSQAFTTKAGLSKPVIKSLEEVSVEGVEAPYSNIKVTFDPIEEDAEEEIKYGLIWDIMNEKFTSFYDGKSAEDKEGVTQIIEKVNGGNRYVVCLYAYEETEGKGTIVYSDENKYQLAPVDDKQIPLGLYYTNEADTENYGELVDIVNPATWIGESSPRSTTTFNWGMFDRLGSYALKFKLTDEMLEYDNYNLKIIFASQKSNYNEWAINGTTLAYAVKVYLINPLDGNTLRTFVEYPTSSSTDSFHVPDLSSATSSSGSKPSSTSVGAWIKNFEKYMFNNSVYFGIYVPPTYNKGYGEDLSNDGNCVAFSYYY